MGQVNIDDMIGRLLNVGMAGGRLTTCVSEDELKSLCCFAKNVFMSQPSLIEVGPPIVVCGDIHGQYSDLLRIFEKTTFPPDANFIFWATMLIVANRISKPSRSCFATKSSTLKASSCFAAITNTFNWMPLCGLIATRILCMHGGLSPQIQQIEQLRNLTRPQDPPNPSIGIDLLWADPDRWVKGWEVNNRGVSYVFGQDVVIDFCERMNIDLVARAHQVVQDGYEFFASRKMVTIFSAPHYCGQFDNSAATMKVNEDLQCTFDVYRPTAKVVRMQQQE
ncbi:unnamed protein product, partial [Mesorhabditis belari]|uniref:protein-serine/threonine phosphatase n=1 Tax=Mesorhabditis belari TaxID=2138241 RepID=A0AAF3FLP6_9BILA